MYDGNLRNIQEKGQGFSYQNLQRQEIFYYKSCSHSVIVKNRLLTKRIFSTRNLMNDVGGYIMRVHRSIANDGVFLELHRGTIN